VLFRSVCCSSCLNIINPTSESTMISFTVTLAALCVSSSAAFSTLPSLVRSRSALNAFAVATEDDAIYLMHRAQECAFSDSCSVEEAEGYLHDVLHVQSGCAAGTLSSHAVCEEQDVVAEIVANLRAKVNGSRTAARRASSEASALLSESNVQLASAVAIAMVMAGLVGTHNFGGEAREALTLQEWMWALQGGYLNTMTSHFINHGGL